MISKEINKCDLATCRYNHKEICQNEEKRKECVEVSEAVLYLEDMEMNRTEVSIRNISEIIIRQNESEKNISVNGESVDLSKLVNMSVYVDSAGIRIEAKIIDGNLPIKS